MKVRCAGKEGVMSEGKRVNDIPAKQESGNDIIGSDVSARRI